MSDTEALRKRYEEIFAREVELQGGLRQCESDVASLLEYETNWTSVRDAVRTMDDKQSDCYLRGLAISTISRSRRAVSSFTDTEYERVKMRYREMRGWEYDYDA